MYVFYNERTRSEIETRRIFLLSKSTFLSAWYLHWNWNFAWQLFATIGECVALIATHVFPVIPRCQASLYTLYITLMSSNNPLSHLLTSSITSSYYARSVRPVTPVTVSRIVMSSIILFLLLTDDRGLDMASLRICPSILYRGKFDSTFPFILWKDIWEST